MKLKSDIELKVRRFFRKYKKFIIIGFVLWAIVFALDKVIKYMPKNETPSTTYTPNVSVMDSSSKVPDKVHNKMEDFIEEYIGYCNSGDYTSAYGMISEDCKEEYFGSFSNYVSYIKNRFPTKKSYAIQSYSNTKVKGNKDKKYIYAVKLFDDFLATGLTNSSYRYLEEKMVASYDENKKVVFSVGNFIEKNEIQSVQENNYLKVDIKNQIVNYDFEEYTIKLTNRSDYTIVIQNYEAEEDEILINLGQEVRTNSVNENITLNPGEAKTIRPVFSKFYDDGDTTKSVIFNAVRVYDENGNEIDKMSMTMGF